jgi:transcriptional regulator with XRE-family HTH domain
MTSLAAWLKDQDISDAEFGGRIGCDRGSVGRYARGERFPTPATLVRIREETGGLVNADDMLRTWEAKNPGQAPEGEGAVDESGAPNAVRDASAGELVARPGEAA